jgi:hypothetical protein
MKKILILVLLLTGLFTLSCEEFLDAVSPGDKNLTTNSNTITINVYVTVTNDGNTTTTTSTLPKVTTPRAYRYYDKPYLIYLSCETQGATIKFSLISSDPFNYGAVYTGNAINVSIGTYLWVVASKSGYQNSDIAIFRF